MCLLSLDILVGHYLSLDRLRLISVSTLKINGNLDFQKKILPHIDKLLHSACV